MEILYIYIIPYKLKNLEKVCYRVIGKLMILGEKSNGRASLITLQSHQDWNQTLS